MHTRTLTPRRLAPPLLRCWRGARRPAVDPRVLDELRTIAGRVRSEEDAAPPGCGRGARLVDRRRCSRA